MSGDVFGNGMLLSRHIKLIGAFDHRHVFLDPDPDPEASFAERERLFWLPRSSWADYDEALISKGGGVFPRTAKSIELSPEVRGALGIEARSLPPNELMRAILRAPVDLLWNGGIGTYVKARDERHADVGDKANDNIRVDAEELCARVVGEGGNLGFTQRGRIAYALGGGRIFMDAIDNSAGVDCSDHEVNIKILLDTIVADGDLTEKQRNSLLAEMEDEVGELVLRDNYEQAQALYTSAAQAASMLEVHERYLRALEQSGALRRESVASRRANDLVNRARTTFAFRLQDETGAGADDVVRAYIAAVELYRLRRVWAEIEALDGNVPAQTQVAMLLKVRILLERSTRWLLRNRRRPLDVAEAVSRYSASVAALADALPTLLQPEPLVSEGVPEALAQRVAYSEALVPA